MEDLPQGDLERVLEGLRDSLAIALEAIEVLRAGGSVTVPALSGALARATDDWRHFPWACRASSLVAAGAADLASLEALALRVGPGDPAARTGQGRWLCRLEARIARDLARAGGGRDHDSPSASSAAASDSHSEYST